jgi:hypothetical protein
VTLCFLRGERAEHAMRSRHLAAGVPLLMCSHTPHSIIHINTHTHNIRIDIAFILFKHTEHTHICPVFRSLCARHPKKPPP